MTESHYQECPQDHPFAGVTMVSVPREESLAEMQMRLENERLRRTNKNYLLSIRQMAEEIRNLKAATNELPICKTSH